MGPPPPSREGPLLVFGQRVDARVDIDAWNAHAARFFETRIGLATAGAPGTVAGVEAPATADTSFVVAPEGEAPGVRSARARPTAPADLALADAAEARAGGGGLALLARRCGIVWLVTREGPRDALALRLAAILASVLLGPILDADAGEIFGVKTARAKLEALDAPAARGGLARGQTIKS
jgi:hypothetical protein